MDEHVVLQLLMMLLWNASMAIIMSFGVSIANVILHLSNSEIKYKNCKDAFHDGYLKTWPMYLFCMIVPISLKSVCFLALANIATPIIIEWATHCVPKDIIEPRKHLEHVCIISILWFTLELYLIVNWSLFFETSQVTSLSKMDELFFIQLLIVLVQNAVKSIPLILAICVAQTTTFFTNHFLHQIFVCPRTMKMDYQNYHWYHAFLSGFFLEDIALICLIVCAIIPIPWTLIMISSSVIICIPWCIYFASSDDRRFLEGDLMLQLNIVFCLVCLAKEVIENYGKLI